MTLQQLAFFYEISRVLNFTKAAENLYTSQSSLSHTIRALEDELGVPLFVRSRGKKVTLSRYGEILLPHAEKVLEAIEQGKKEIDAAKENERITLHMSHSHSVASICIPGVIDAFEEERGEDRIYFQRNVNHRGYSPITELLDGKTEMVIAACTGDSPELEYITLAWQQLYVLMHKGHPLADRESISIEDLRGENLVLMRDNADLNRLIYEMMGEDIPQSRIQYCSDWGTMCAAVTSKQVVAISPKLGMATGIIRQIPIKHKDALRPLNLIYRREEKPAVVQEFIDFCREYGKRGVIV